MRPMPEANGVAAAAAVANTTKYGVRLSQPTQHAHTNDEQLYRVQA